MDDQHARKAGWSRRSVLRTLGVAGVGVAGLTVSPAIPVDPAAAQSPFGFSTEDVTVDSADGIAIAATVYLPSADGPHPAVLLTHGWGGNRQTLFLQASAYAASGYVVLTYDSRGFGESGGQVTLNGEPEVADARTLITWLGEHDAVATDDGGEPRVGMDGSSYGGGIQLRTAAVDDRLDAIVPRITWRDLPDAHAPNGVFKVAWSQALQAAGERSGTIAPEVERITEAALERRELTEAFTTFYRARSPTAYLEAVDTPTLFVHSWYDRLFPPDQVIANFQALSDRGVETALVLQDAGGHHLGGPPSATATEREYVTNATQSWLDAHVAGDGDHGLPAVSLYDDSSDSFLEAERFPPADVQEETDDLGIDGTVRLGHPGSGAGADKSDGGAGADHPGDVVATFDFPIEAETEILGTPTLTVPVVPQGNGTVRLAVALKRVTDEGATTIKDQVTPVAIDEPTTLELDLFPVHGVLAAGDTLRLAVATRDQAIDDVEIPAEISDTGAFADSDDGTSLLLQGRGTAGGTLSVPVRESGGWDATGDGDWADTGGWTGGWW